MVMKETKPASAMSWHVRNLFLLPVLFLATVLTTACGIPAVARVVYGEFSDVHASAGVREDFAILDYAGVTLVTRILRHADQTVVYDRQRDGMKARFILTPDTYVVEYTAAHHKIGRRVFEDVVELRPGHSYRVESNACYALSFGPSCRYRPSYSAGTWIEDDTTGEVLAAHSWGRLH